MHKSALHKKKRKKYNEQQLTHYPVMQVSDKLRHVEREEGSVSVYRISCQHGGALFWDPLLNVGKYLARHTF